MDDALSIRWCFWIMQLWMNKESFTSRESNNNISKYNIWLLFVLSSRSIHYVNYVSLMPHCFGQVTLAGGKTAKCHTVLFIWFLCWCFENFIGVCLCDLFATLLCNLFRLAWSKKQALIQDYYTALLVFFSRN